MNNETKVLNALKNHKKSTIEEIVKLTNLHKITVLKCLINLQKQDKVRIYKPIVINGYLDEYHLAARLKLTKYVNINLFD